MEQSETTNKIQKVYRPSKKIEEIHHKYMQFLNRIPIQERPLMRTAYYLYHLNHYAKLNQEYLYELKYKVLSILYKMYKDTPYFQVQYVKGEDKVQLCYECMDDIREERKRGIHRLFTHVCAHCAVKKEYYSLLDIKIQYKGYKYHFHIPYHEIEKWFDVDVQSLPVIFRRKEKGKERYGRMITKEEREFLPLEMVIKELENFIRKSAV